jgi:hypothetical protein
VILVQIRDAKRNKSAPESQFNEKFGAHRRDLTANSFAPIN